MGTIKMKIYYYILGLILGLVIGCLLGGTYVLYRYDFKTLKPTKASACLGLNEKENVWNRIRVDEKGYVICSQEKPLK